ncbi:MAG: hypothetical protein A2W93_07645 [Bacteroidetes bacterium GWF2_43_63]|nr:MAG: hypothetical protein A2W94_09500 [Bacteroidetes bacterium GWE2_42_42]OFY53042.1 MAG: hypothetical protein A2W93_07645 [Bacteroidetes bacterium GWF2_43_63]HBG69195.1 hypothetical protein [Bacteroidales bacterium]HCB62534.1 hypothetical protein [Bacteroidales bacterium]
MKKSSKFYLDPIMEPEDAFSLMEGLARTIDLNFSQDFVVSDVGVSSRILNNWKNLGLMSNRLRIENSIYRFSFVELIWINIIKELREFGFSLPKISLVRQTLLISTDFSEYFRSITVKEKNSLLKRLNTLRIRDEQSKKQFIETMRQYLDDKEKQKEPVYTNILNIIINEFILYREEVKLLIDVNGTVIPVIESEKDSPVYEKLMDDTGFDRESYITISLLKFFRKFILNKNYFEFVRDNRILNEHETHILALLREGMAKTITIRFKDQKPYLIEVTREKKIHAEARLSEILIRGGYQDISMKTENGNIVITNITSKIKLDQ